MHIRITLDHIKMMGRRLDGGQTTMHTAGTVIFEECCTWDATLFLFFKFLYSQWTICVAKFRHSPLAEDESKPVSHLAAHFCTVSSSWMRSLWSGVQFVRVENNAYTHQKTKLEPTTGSQWTWEPPNQRVVKATLEREWQWPRRLT